MAYLKNAWYAAAWDNEVTADKPLARTFLDEPVVLFRDATGKAAALYDRCPHRFAPLSMGKIVGGTVQCLYHGLQFGADGRCAHNPHGPLIAAARTTSYPLIERHGVIWIWMGDPAKVDASKVPDMSFLTAKDRYAVIRTTFMIPANYQLIIDNLMDLTHAQFLHPFLGNTDSSVRLRFTSRVDGTTVWSLSDMPGEPVSQFFRLMWPTGPETGDKRQYMRWDAPGNLVLDVGYAPCGGAREDGPGLLAANLLTPETLTTTHYFWGGARDALREDERLSAMMRKGIEAVFMNEDAPMIAACQQRMGTTELMSLKPLLLNIDAAAVTTRRVLDDLLAKEGASRAG